MTYKSKVKYSDKLNHVQLLDKCPVCKEEHKDLEVKDKSDFLVVECPKEKKNIFLIYS